MILNFTNLFFVREKPRYINDYANFTTNETITKNLENTSKVPVFAHHGLLYAATHLTTSENVFVSDNTNHTITARYALVSFLFHGVFWYNTV